MKGGEIVRDAHGRPTGLLKDNAMTLVASKVPPPSDALKDGARCHGVMSQPGCDERPQHGNVGGPRGVRGPAATTALSTQTTPRSR